MAVQQDMAEMTRIERPSRGREEVPVRLSQREESQPPPRLDPEHTEAASTRILGWSRGHMQCAAGRASARDLRKDQDGRPSRRQAPS